MIEFTKQANGFYKHTMQGNTGTLQIKLVEGGHVVLSANLSGMPPCVVASTFSDNVILNLAYSSSVTLTIECDKEVESAKFVEV